MKKYLYLLIALCTLGACSDFLDETPKGTLIPKTVDDFALMMEDNDDYGGYNNTNAGPTIVTMLDDDIKITDSPVKLSRYSQAALRAFRWENNFYTRSENDDNYNELYHCIYNCNYILENVETAQEGGAFTRDYVRGAACFHRAAKQRRYRFSVPQEQGHVFQRYRHVRGVPRRGIPDRCDGRRGAAVHLHACHRGDRLEAAAMARCAVR